MPITRYITANGMLLGERTDSGPRIDYVPDALGSIVAAVDQNLNTTYTAAYTPYGAALASTGTAPNFTWVGNVGYLAAAGRPYAEYSVRARVFSSKSGGWTSLDPLWPAEASRAYARARVATLIDPSGLRASCCCCVTGASASATYIKGPAPSQIPPAIASYWRGYHIVLSFGMDQSPPQAGPVTSPCSLTDDEQAYLNGVDISWVNVPWTSSDQYRQYLACSSLLAGVPPCSTSVACEINDWVGAVPFAPGPFAGPYARQVTDYQVNIQYTLGANTPKCGCVQSVIECRVHLKWSNTTEAEPDYVWGSCT